MDAAILALQRVQLAAGALQRCWRPPFSSLQRRMLGAFVDSLIRAARRTSEGGVKDILVH